jgi:hypothetical protein
LVRGAEQLRAEEVIVVFCFAFGFPAFAALLGISGL